MSAGQFARRKNWVGGDMTAKSVDEDVRNLRLVLGNIDKGKSGFTGTTTNNNAIAGDVGEYVESNIIANTSTPASGVWGDLTSISLTAGDWDISGMVDFNGFGATCTSCALGITTTAGNTAPFPGLNGMIILPPANAIVGDSSGSIPSIRASIASTETYYLKFEAVFSAGQPVATGSIRARRMR